MCGRGTWASIPLGIPGLSWAGCGSCSQAPRGLEAMGGFEGPCHGGVSQLSKEKKNAIFVS